MKSKSALQHLDCVDILLCVFTVSSPEQDDIQRYLKPVKRKMQLLRKGWQMFQLTLRRKCVQLHLVWKDAVADVGVDRPGSRSVVIFVVSWMLALTSDYKS